MKIKKLLEIVNGIPLNLENPESQIKNFIINSKESTKGSFFVPLKGNKTDGHLFIEDAVNRGSVGFFTEKHINLKNGILIKNSLKALEKVFKEIGVSKPKEESKIFGAILDGMGYHYIFDKENYPLEKMRRYLIKKYSKENLKQKIK